MAPLFEFGDMLQDYETDIQIITTENDKSNNGGYDEETGEWKGNKTPINPKPIEARGVMLPYSANEIYQSGGRLTQQSRQLIINMDIPSKAEVVHDNQKYSVESKTGYEGFADFSQYELKWVSAFG
ncbi:hypothetical protein [Rummeliibacillus sp. TYF-LIM-RU47]|uniref:hypothetical protein n=1 Tax=Rummeliibacillus sp. TYF-LIM-RU47 TaxID=2608406 RepID=UPI00123C0777|nr:hypothetical protein [Rummeliibacillus sp. TYF-LIM-RU47]